MDAILIPYFNLQNELHPQDRHVMKYHLKLYRISRNCEGVPEELQAKFIQCAHGKSQVVTTNQWLQDKYWHPEPDMKNWSLILKLLTKIKTSDSWSTITAYPLLFFSVNNWYHSQFWQSYIFLAIIPAI